MTDIDIVKASFDAYQAQDRDAAERLFARDFRFTSPQDDYIDRAEWFTKCFPTADHSTTTDFLEFVSTDHGVIVLYEYTLHNGETYRNTELIRVEGEQIVETQVFFGGRVYGP